MITASKQTSVGRILGLKIMTDEGKVVGHVADLKLTGHLPYKVTALYFGGTGWLHRWHVLYPFAELFGFRVEKGEVPWEAIERITAHTIYLKTGWPKTNGRLKK